MKEVVSLSDRELVALLDMLVKNEHSAMLEVLTHLSEVDERKLYLGLGYNSLFAYCVEKYRYSEGAVMRRIKAARCLRKYPAVFAYLQSKKISLCALAVVSDVITADNIKQLLDACTGKSKREVERIVCEYKPEEKRQIREEIKPIAFKAAGKLKRVKTTGLQRKSNEKQGNYRKPTTRHIPQEIKDAVAARDEYRCSFVGPEEKRCSCRTDLEFDHVFPFSLGGQSTADNLRLLCRSHNLHAAENVYGKHYMKQRIRAVPVSNSFS